MQWAKPTHKSKGEIDRAGDVLISDTTSDEEKNKALEILNNWRAIHSYPMHVFKIRLKEYSKKVDKNVLTAQRLKRNPSIIKKLKREYEGRPATMNLSQMQDIAGCRAVFSSVSQVEKLYEKYYLRGDLKHENAGINNYIKTPKKDGYRSLHLIYSYKSDKERKKIYNGLLVEIQLRSKLQHLWATAIETVDFFTRQAIKSNEGEQEWQDFFKLVSSAFAKMENCPIVPNTPKDETELYSQIKKKEAELKVIDKMKNWAKAVRHFSEEAKTSSNAEFFLLELDILGEKLTYRAYTKKQEEKAVAEYAELEKKFQGKKEYDVVLVGVDTLSDLRKAYPNYFVDTGEFLENLQKILKKAN